MDLLPFHSVAAADGLLPQGSLGGSTPTPTASPTPSPFHDDSVASVKFAVYLNVGILVIGLVTFQVLLRRPTTRDLVAPLLLRRRRSEDGTPGAASWVPSDVQERLGLAAQSISSTLLGWIREPKKREADIDVDGLALVRFCKLGFRFSLAGSLLACVLIPAYSCLGKSKAQGFNEYGLANLEAGNPAFWLVVVASYALTAVFAHLAHAEFSKIAELRQKHLQKACRGMLGAGPAQAQRSLIIEDIPEAERTVEHVQSLFQRLFGEDAVHSCVLQQDTAAVHKVMALRTATTRCCGCMKTAPDAVERVAGAVVVGVTDARDEVLRAAAGGAASPTRSGRAAAVDAVRDRTFQAARVVVDATVGGGKVSTAFVTFNRVADRLIAEDLLLVRRNGWQVGPAPVAQDVIWGNACTTFSQQQVRHLLARFACAIGLVWWAVPVTAVQAWASASNLERWFPRVHNLEKLSPVLYTALVSYLPVIALMGLLKLLPYVFYSLSTTYEKFKLRPAIRALALCRNLNYQLVTLYVTVLSGSLFDSLETIVAKGPVEAISEMRQQIPQVSVYFITFVLARIGTSLPLILLQFPTAYLYGSEVEVNCYYEQEAADIALVLVLALTYSVIAPAILPVCALYFGLAVLVYRYLFLYVYTPDVDCGGALWYDLFRASSIGLVLGNTVLMSLAGLNQGPYSWEFILMVPLPVLSFAFLWYCNSQLRPAALRMTFEEAVANDRACAADPEVPEALAVASGFSANYYLDPMAGVAASEEPPSEAATRQTSMQEVSRA
eukprot:TRINITY_DN64043_c0_g1_i1.p1 TRINITY_DN64043_c0_g1~~TRINITY_DN64043_c0_g1_i1.p1  ORF type:complete len:780 (-),score=118.01 TRINITY_DN64043_c0_g1_i1:136-2475(-)